MAKVESGQLRRWGPRAVVHAQRGSVFVLLGINEEFCRNSGRPPIGARIPQNTAWDFLIDGAIDWHFEDVIMKESEVVSEA